MSRTEQKIIRRQKRVRAVIYLICLFVSFTSLSYAKIISKENSDIKDLLRNNKDVPLHIRQEIGV